MTNHQLGVVLVSLLPKDGTPRSVSWLADLTQVAPAEVRGALAEWPDARVAFDAIADCYRFVRSPEIEP